MTSESAWHFNNRLLFKNFQVMTSESSWHVNNRLLFKNFQVMTSESAWHVNNRLSFRHVQLKKSKSPWHESRRWTSESAWHEARGWTRIGWQMNNMGLWYYSEHFFLTKTKIDAFAFSIIYLEHLLQHWDLYLVTFIYTNYIFYKK